jgi:hypothetical protein
VKVWTKRAGYLLLILLWLLLVSFPVVAFLLATQGEIEFGDSRSGLRLFLLQDSDSQGLGLQWTRPYDNGSPSAAVACTRTTLRYLLWQGSAPQQNTAYCQCFNPQTQEPLPLDACVLP